MAVKKFEHVPVLASEATGLLITNLDGVYVDGTFGRGGHARLFLSRLSPKGRLIALDRDGEAIAAASSIKDPRFRAFHCPFSEMAEVVRDLAIDQVDGVFLDIGVSSPQVDDARRGFSFRFEGPLDMRMDNSQALTAADWLSQATVGEMVRVFKDYGEEKFASLIARSVEEERKKQAITTTTQLANLVSRVVPHSSKDASQHPATRVFQAIRIKVNQEFEQLKKGLDAAGQILAPKGVLGVITFHSLEDRIVKRFFSLSSNPAQQIDSKLPLRESDLPQATFKHVRRTLPTPEEITNNPRSRSAILRTAERTEVPWRNIGEIL